MRKRVTYTEGYCCPMMCLVLLCKACVQAEYLSTCIVLHVTYLKPLDQNYLLVDL